MALLLIKKATILKEYLIFFNIFFKKKVLELLKTVELNQYAIKLQKKTIL